MDNFDEILNSLKKMKMEELSVLYFKIKYIKFKEQMKHHKQESQFDKLLCEIDSMISYDNHKPFNSSDSDNDSDSDSDSKTSLKPNEIQLLDEFSEEI
jgi:hypothetical protein